MTFGQLGLAVHTAAAVTRNARMAEAYRGDSLASQMDAMVMAQETGAAYGAMSLPAVYASVRLIASSLDQLPVTVNNGPPPGWLENPRSMGGHFDLGDLVMHCVTSMSLVGAAYIQATPYTRSWQLEPLRATSVSVQQSASGPVRLTYLVDGDEVQHVPYKRPTKQNKQTKRYEYTDVGRRYILHIPYLVTPEAPWGLSPIQAVQQTIAGLLDVERQASNLLRLGHHSGGVLETDHEISPEQAVEIRDRWVADRRTGKVAVTGHGVKYRSETLDPKSGQFLENRAYGAQAIAACFGIPPAYLGLTLMGGASSLSYANAQDNQAAFKKNCLAAYSTQIEAGLSSLFPSGTSVHFDWSDWEGGINDRGSAQPDPADNGGDVM